MSNLEPIRAKWHTKYASAGMEDGHMVIRYRFPYTSKREAALLGAYGLTPADRAAYYEILSRMVERNLLMSDYFKEEAVPNVLAFSSACQVQEEGGVICVYAIPEQPVTPISQSLLSSDCNALTLLHVFLRLTQILRDIYKTPISPVLRYLDMDDVYMTEDRKILLGGFYYTAAIGMTQPPPFLPDAAEITATNNGERPVDIGWDMQILAQIAWNVFSGLPWNARHTPLSARIPPRYAPAALRNTLQLGLGGNSHDFNQFRKQMLQCSKELSKTAFADTVIPMAPVLKKNYQFCRPEPTPPTADAK